ncbi:MAG: PHP domain-containing protein [Candidatus Bathyarchaeota archaeon]|nr:PHP domain-containing protein [Candidatus Bathyarchaeota archaeon]
MLRVDLHLHTVFSGDSTISPKLIVDQLHSHPLIKGVAIADHNTLEGYFQVHRLASVYEDLVILPGIEISTEKGDIIILGVEEKPEYPVTLNSAIEFAKTKNGVIVIPHPYRSRGIGDLAMDIDAHAIEVLNPTATPKENMLAQKLAKTKGVSSVAGTDAHNVRELWTVSTEVDAQLTVESVLDAIQKGFVKAVDSRAANLVNRD